jgi:hypothetical protein
MKVFVAATTGPIARPLITGLLRQDDVATGLPRCEAGSRHLPELGEEIARVCAIDGDAVERALRQSQAEIIFDQLTSLPKDPSEMAAAAAGNPKLRLECGGNLHGAAGVSLEQHVTPD